MAFGRIVESFAETTRKRDGLFSRIQVGNVAVRHAAEGCDPLLPLFRIDGRYRSGGRRKMLHQRHGRLVEQVRQDNGGRPEVAEKHQRIPVGFFHGIINKGANLSVAPFFFFQNIILTTQYSYPYLFVDFTVVL